MSFDAEYHKQFDRIKKGGQFKNQQKYQKEGKLFVRDRLNLLLDNGIEVEDGLFANYMDSDFPADGVITGQGKINGQTVCFMANDSTVNAGSWGGKTVEKIIRIQENAEKLMIPIFYLIDSSVAGNNAIQVNLFPGRRGTGRILYNQVKLSGLVPQICVLFGPSADVGNYIPVFCDFVMMVEGRISGFGDVHVKSEREAIERAKIYLSYFPVNYLHKPPISPAVPPLSFKKTLAEILPANQKTPFNMHQLIKRVIDKASFFEINGLYAKEMITGFARIEGKPIGIIANQSMVKGGNLFTESADKAAKFITLCDAFHIPLLFLTDVPAIMLGTEVERAGMIHHSAKMIAAVSKATVPKISVIVRKAYGFGLYAMAGPAFDPDCCLAFPNAHIAPMDPEDAIKDVYANEIADLTDKEKRIFIEKKIAQYSHEIDLYRLASDLVIDGIVPPDSIRKELVSRFDVYMSKYKVFSERKHQVYPV